LEKKIKGTMRPPRYDMEGWTQRNWETGELVLKEDAPQWAWEEYHERIATMKRLKERGIKA